MLQITIIQYLINLRKYEILIIIIVSPKDRSAHLLSFPRAITTNYPGSGGPNLVTMVTREEHAPPFGHVMLFSHGEKRTPTPPNYLLNTLHLITCQLYYSRDLRLVLQLVTVITTVGLQLILFSSSKGAIVD